MEHKVIKTYSEQEFLDKVAECKKEGRRLIDYNVFENGVIGKIAYFHPPDGVLEWSPKDEDVTWVTWEKYGRFLQPEKIIISSSNMLITEYDKHKSHKLIGFTDSINKIAGFICFCKSQEGKSLMFSVSMENKSEMPSELRDLIFQTKI